MIDLNILILMPGQACRTALKCEKYSDFNDKLFQMRKVTPPFIGWSERIVSSSCKNTSLSLSLSDVNLLINPSINRIICIPDQIRSERTSFMFEPSLSFLSASSLSSAWETELSDVSVSQENLASL